MRDMGLSPRSLPCHPRQSLTTVFCHFPPATSPYFLLFFYSLTTSFFSTPHRTEGGLCSFVFFVLPFCPQEPVDSPAPVLSQPSRPYPVQFHFLLDDPMPKERLAPPPSFLTPNHRFRRHTKYFYLLAFPINPTPAPPRALLIFYNIVATPPPQSFSCHPPTTR